MNSLAEALKKIPLTAFVPARHAKVAAMAVNSVIDKQERERIERLKNGPEKQ